MMLPQGFEKTQAYTEICQGFFERLMQQQIGANRCENRSIQVYINYEDIK